MRLNGDVDLPANATAKVGQTSLLGSLHIELAPPTDVAAGGQAARRLADPAGVGRRLPDHRADAGGGVAAAQRRRDRPGPGHHHRRSAPRSPAAKNDLRSLIEQLDKFIGYLNDQTGDIIAATESLNNLVGQFAAAEAGGGQGAARPSPTRWRCCNDQRDNLAEALDQLGKFSALAADSVNQTKDSLGQGAQRPWPGAGIAGRRRAGADPLAELAGHLPVAEGDPRQLVARRLRQPDR